jgi:hypothetical protein
MDTEVYELGILCQKPAPECWKGFDLLAIHNDPESISVLESFLKSEDSHKVRAAISAIGRNVNGKRIASDIIPFLTSQHAYVQRAALEALGRLECRSGRQMIYPFIDCEVESLQIAAIVAINLLWEGSDFGHFLEFFQHHKSETVRKQLGDVIYEHVSFLSWEAVFALFCSDPLPRHRIWAVELADKYGKREMLERFFSDPDGHVRKRAERLWSRSSA